MSGSKTTRRDNIAGHVVISHALLDENADADADSVEELLLLEADFFRSCHAGAHIEGNAEMAARIQRRLDRN